MIKSTDIDDNVLEVQCDICGSVFDDETELDEFLHFDYVMGNDSLYPNFHVRADICQDCFTDRFSKIFDV